MSKEKKKEPFDGFAIERVKDFAPVVELEKRAKCGFYVERILPDVVGVPLYRLCAESKDGDDKNNKILCPWIPVEVLSNMIQGCLYLYPAIISVIKEFQSNAEKPAE